MSDSKSIRELAEEIAEGWTNSEYLNTKLADRVEQALRDERERAAKDCRILRRTVSSAEYCSCVCPYC